MGLLCGISHQRAELSSHQLKACALTDDEGQDARDLFENKIPGISIPFSQNSTRITLLHNILYSNVAKIRFQEAIKNIKLAFTLNQKVH